MCTFEIMKKWIITASLLMGSLILNAQVNDDFSDGNFTSNPSWSGDNSSFEVINGELHLNAPATSDIAHLSTASTSMANSEWEIYLRMEFNPSNNNHGRYYVVSDNSDLEGSLNGYYIKMGGSDDEVSLYRQDGYQDIEIIDGLDGLIDMDPVNIRVKLSRDNLGNWTLYADNAGGTNFTLQGSALDNTHSSSQYCGVYAKYSSSRSTLSYFDDVIGGSCNATTSPTADFATSNTTIAPGTSINFTDQSSQCPTSWAWTFSGASPSSSTDQHPTGITYSNPGTYNVTLTSTNSYGNNTETKTGYITVANGAAPVASFNSSAANPTINTTISFTDLSTNSPTSWNWSIAPSSYSFINGTNANSQNVDIVFSSSGTYTIDFTATNSFGSNTSSQIYFVDDAPCDTLMFYAVPAYSIQPANVSNFQIDKIDNDGLITPQYVLAVTIDNVTGGHGGWADDPDLYIEWFEGSSTLPDWTSSVIDNVFTASWPHPDEPMLLNMDYTIKVWDQDTGYDDLLSEFTFNGISGQTSFSDANSSVTLTTVGQSSNWWEQTDWDGSSYNSYLASTSWYYPAGQADNWLILGPISVPADGADLEWMHKLRSDIYRDGYTVYTSEVGRQINHFLSAGYVIADYIDNSYVTAGDTIWKKQSVNLDANTYGNKTIYLGFQHNADDMWNLYIDDIFLKDCNGVVTDITSIASKNQLKVSPNPASSFIKFELPESFKNNTSKVKIYDLSGKLLNQYIVNGNSFVIQREASIPNGHYIICIEQNGELLRTKIQFN